MKIIVKIFRNTSIPFRAKYLDEVSVMKYNPTDNRYEKSPAAFVELGNEDEYAVKTLNNDWIKAIFIEDIYDDFVSKNDHKFYAVTTQDEDFKKLNPQKILAIGEVFSKGSKYGYLELVEAHPSSYDNPYFEYKLCGSAFSDGLKSQYTKIKLESVSLDEVMNFYKRNKYIQDKNNPKVFTWEA